MHFEQSGLTAKFSGAASGTKRMHESCASRPPLQRLVRCFRLMIPITLYSVSHSFAAHISSFLLDHLWLTKTLKLAAFNCEKSKYLSASPSTTSAKRRSSYSLNSLIIFFIILPALVTQSRSEQSISINTCEDSCTAFRNGSQSAIK